MDQATILWKSQAKRHRLYAAWCLGHAGFSPKVARKL